MPNDAVRFNPLQFFQRTAEFASTGRGMFKLNQPGSQKQALQDILGANNPIFEGYHAKGLNIPPQQLATHEPFSYNGPTTKHAYERIFSDMDVEFLLMGKTKEEATRLYQTFVDWHEYITGRRRRTESTDKTRHIITSGTSSAFAVEYYNNYVTDGEGFIYSPTGEVIIHVKFLEMYPVTIGALQTSWEGAETPLSLTVTFCFYYQYHLDL